MNLEKEQEICSHLELTAKMIGMNLTPTIEGCSVLENILVGLSNFGDEEALNGAIFSSGVYLGKIIRKTTKGHWELSAESQRLGLNISGEVIYPHNAIYDFVSSPHESGISFYAKSIIARSNA